MSRPGCSGWSARQAAACLGLDHVRVLRWAARRVAGQLADVRPGPVEALRALLPWEREAIVKLAAEWGEVDQSHRKLAHRGSRLDRVHVSESTVLRVLTDEGVHLPRPPARDPGPRSPWPQWADWRPGVIWVYDFTHFTRAKRCTVAVLDVLSRYWLSTVVSAEETSVQIQNASFLSHLTDQRRSPNTVRAYAFDLKDYFAYLTSRGLDWAQLRYDELAGFKPWLRLPPAARAGEIAVLPSAQSACIESTINRKLAAVTSFYEFHARHGLAMALIIRSAARPVAAGAIAQLRYRRVGSPAKLTHERLSNPSRKTILHLRREKASIGSDRAAGPGGWPSHRRRRGRGASRRIVRRVSSRARRVSRCGRSRRRMRW